MYQRFFGRISDSNSRIGLWLLEDFIRPGLIERSDPTFADIGHLFDQHERALENEAKAKINDFPSVIFPGTEQHRAWLQTPHGQEWQRQQRQGEGIAKRLIRSVAG